MSKPGRPPRAGSPSRRRIEVRLTEEELAQAKAYASEQGTTVSEAIREWLRRYSMVYQVRIITGENAGVTMQTKDLAYAKQWAAKFGPAVIMRLSDRSIVDPGQWE